MGESTSLGLALVLGAVTYGILVLYLAAGLVIFWLLMRRRWIIGGGGAIALLFVATVPWWQARQAALAEAAAVFTNDRTGPLPSADSFSLVVVEEDPMGIATFPFVRALTASGAVRELGWADFAWRDDNGTIVAPFWQADADYTYRVDIDASGNWLADFDATVTAPDLVLLSVREWDDPDHAGQTYTSGQVTRFILFAAQGQSVSLKDDRLWQAHRYDTDVPSFPYNPNNTVYYPVRGTDDVLADLVRTICQAARDCDPQALDAQLADMAP
ncbi:MULTISPECIES: hypothetical protein [unclassified Yoonia]|uniref:hypothetical protein n=1 Tax=unclassified Yoonia TaxID=2629118 RepID=UPI002B001296|nr:MULTISPECIES: hypothetical protein [unclassified Yoonia]